MGAGQEYLRVHGEKLASMVEGFDLQAALAASKHTELDQARGRVRHRAARAESF